MKKLVDLLRTTFPVIQGPMLGVTTPEMAAAVSNAGGLGSLPVGGLSPEVTGELIRRTKALTKKPFAVNLFAHAVPEKPDERQLLDMQEFLRGYASQHALPFAERRPDEFRFYSYREQVPVLLEEAVRIVSFTFGAPAPDIVRSLKGAVLLGTATSVGEAMALEKAGVDVIVAQGFEAGGHRGSFQEGELPQVGLFALLPQTVDAVKLPVIAAGGIFDGRTIRAAFTLGAAGVQVGTLFIPADESAASEGYKQAVLSAKDTDTKLTRALSGRWARGIRNRLMVDIEAAGVAIPEYTVQNSLTSGIRAHGQKNGKPEYVSLWAGQAAGRAVKDSAAAIFNRLIEGVSFDYQ